MTPFQLSFITDADEVTGAAAPVTPGTNEAVVAAVGGVANIPAAGTLGFSLGFEQVPCA